MCSLGVLHGGLEMITVTIFDHIIGIFLLQNENCQVLIIKSWIRIYINLKCWILIRIRIETNVDPQQWSRDTGEASKSPKQCWGSGMFFPDPGS
jgi:hypothetical protein